MIMRNKVLQFLTLCGYALLIAVSSLTFAQEAQESSAKQAPAQAGVPNEFEGIVKTAIGKYFYLPAAQGYDVVIQGKIEGQDASVLVGKNIRLKGSLLKDEPSVLVADSIDVKDAGGQYRNVFTRTEEVQLEDHINTSERAAFAVLNISSATKSEDWEGKGNARVFGSLVTETKDGKDVYTIVISDDKGKEVGRILVNSETDYARYYIKKLRLYDKFWFYLNIKDTVDLKIRRKTRELFHADLLFAGLF